MRHSRTRPVAAVVNNADFNPNEVGRTGERVRIRSGEVPDYEGTRPVASAAGVAGRLDGAPYVANGGPNKGRLIQPVRVEGQRNVVLGVPTDRLQRSGGAKSRGGFGYSHIPDDTWERIFGPRRKK